jgi:hypothetical protein
MKTINCSFDFYGKFKVLLRYCKNLVICLLRELTTLTMSIRVIYYSLVTTGNRQGIFYPLGHIREVRRPSKKYWVFSKTTNTLSEISLTPYNFFPEDYQ